MNIVTFLCGAASSLAAAFIYTRIIRAQQKRENARQWESIEQFLSKPALLVAVGGSGSINTRPNCTKWSVVVRPRIEVPESSLITRAWFLGHQECTPSSGAVWSLNRDLVSHVRDPDTKVYAEVSYEPVHKNIGNVNGVEIGEMVRLTIDFKPQEMGAEE
jgi:hypothetical protein